MKNMLTLFAFLFVFTDLLFCQNDFFPLSPGNYFTYNYEWYSGHTGPSSYDYESYKGWVKYEILSNTVTDSVIYWNAKESAELIRTVYESGHTTIDTVKGLNTFVLYEKKDVQHTLTATTNYCIWDAKFNPFCSNLCRFYNDSLIHEIKYNEGANFVRIDTIRLQKNVGMIFKYHAEEQYGINSYYKHILAILAESYVADVNENNESAINNYALMQNYPNPFNPNTTISYQLPKSGQVTIKVYDVLGNEVKTLINEYKTAGSYSVNFDAGKLSSGMYIYRITADGFTSAKKMLLIK
jgi:hypothetical protein